MTSQAIKFCSRNLGTSLHRIPMSTIRPSFTCLGSRSIQCLQASQVRLPRRCLSSLSNHSMPSNSLMSKMVPAGLVLGAGGVVLWLHDSKSNLTENIPIEDTAFSAEVHKHAKQMKDILEMPLSDAELFDKLQGWSSLLSPDVLLCLCHEKKLRDKLIVLCVSSPQNFLHEKMRKMLENLNPSKHKEEASFVKSTVKEIAKRVSPSHDQKATEIGIVLVRDFVKALASKVDNVAITNPSNASYIDQMQDFLSVLPRIHWERLGKALVEEGTIVKMCLQTQWSTLKSDEDSRVFSVIGSLMTLSGNEKYLVKMFKRHLKDEISLPARFLGDLVFHLSNPYSNEDEKRKNQALARKILASFPNDDELRKYAQKTEDGNIACLVAATRAKLPKFPSDSWEEFPVDSWEECFMKMLEITPVFSGMYPVSLENRKVIGWSLYLGIPLSQLFRTNLSTSSMKSQINFNTADWIKFFTSFEDVQTCNAAFVNLLPFLTRNDGWASNSLQAVLVAINKKYASSLPIDCCVRTLGNYLKGISQLQRNLHAGQSLPLTMQKGKARNLFLFNDEMGCSLTPAERESSTEKESFLTMMSQAIIKECRAQEDWDGRIPSSRKTHLLKLFCVYYSPGDLVTPTGYEGARLVSKIFEDLDEKEMAELFDRLLKEKEDNHSLLKILRAIGYAPNEAGCKRFIGRIQAMEDTPEKRELLGNLEIATSMFGR